MKPAIDQMIAWLEGEVAGYAGLQCLERGYQALTRSLDKAKEIKKQCDADEIEQVVAAEMLFNNGFGPAVEDLDTECVAKVAVDMRESWMRFRAEQRNLQACSGVQVLAGTDSGITSSIDCYARPDLELWPPDKKDSMSE